MALKREKRSIWHYFWVILALNIHTTAQSTSMKKKIFKFHKAFSLDIKLMTWITANDRITKEQSWN